MHKALKSIRLLAGGVILLMASACNGVFDDIYDTPSNATNVMQGQLFVNATSWKDWYYVDFDSLQQYVERRIRLVCRGLRPSSQLIQYQQLEHHLTEKRVYIPIGSMSLERVSQSMSGVVTHQQEHNQSLHHGVLHSIGTMFGRTEEQCWKPVTLPLTSYQRTVQSYRSCFTGDEWSESEVWADQSQMLSGIIGCQGITINKVLSSWLRINIPPMPPQFTLNSHVFIIRLKNGKYAAVQLKNYMDTSGTKCWLTINYKYPY